MWIIGVDEAGYGPNLGSFVMTSVACRVPDDAAEANLWQLLGGGVPHGADADEGQLLIDDSKLVYVARGLSGLERAVLAALAGRIGVLDCRMIPSLAAFVESACPDDGDEEPREIWYRGDQTLPIHGTPADLESGMLQFEQTCITAQMGHWQIRSVVICPSRFNALLDEGGSKGHVLAHALTHLLRWQHANLEGQDALSFFIDKHGGRNTYAAMLQHALPGSVVLTQQESMASSVYRVHGLGCAMRLTFQPRADAEHLCVALASMTSKYLRELLMLEFNRFWREQVPELKPTAGYPGDAARFFQAIRQAMAKLGLREECVWRRK